MALKKKTLKKTVKQAPRKAQTKKVYVAPPQMAPGAFVDEFHEQKAFFESVKEAFGPLRQMQVDGFNSIIAEWNKAKLTDPRYLAYMLATTWHETAATMQPITEYGGTKYLRSKKYWPFIGRGYVQLTWKDNYKKYGLDKTPLKALEPAVAAHVMLDGMVNGIFTSKKLSDYFAPDKNDPVNARRIINGTDKAEMIAGHHEKFLKAITAGQEPLVGTPA